MKIQIGSPDKRSREKYWEASNDRERRMHDSSQATSVPQGRCWALGEDYGYKSLMEPGGSKMQDLSGGPAGKI